MDHKRDPASRPSEEHSDMRHLTKSYLLALLRLVGDSDGDVSEEDVSGKLTLKVDGKKVGSGSSGTTGKWEEDEVTVRIGSCES